MLQTLLSWVKRVIVIMWLLFMAVLGASIVFENAELLSITLFGISLPPLGAGIYLSLLFALGVAFGSITSYVLTRGKSLVKGRELSRTRKEVERLRTAHLKG